MGLLDEIKSLATTIQKIDNIELYRKILDLQAEAMKLLEEKAAVEKENRQLHDKLKIGGELEFEHNVYWRQDEDTGRSDGPFCSNCWDSMQRLVRLHQKENPNYIECPTCKQPIKKGDAPPRRPTSPFKAL